MNHRYGNDGLAYPENGNWSWEHEMDEALRAKRALSRWLMAYRALAIVGVTALTVIAYKL